MQTTPTFSACNRTSCANKVAWLVDVPIALGTLNASTQVQLADVFAAMQSNATQPAAAQLHVLDWGVATMTLEEASPPCVITIIF